MSDRDRQHDDGLLYYRSRHSGSRKGGGQAVRRKTHFDSIHGPVLAKGSSQQELRKKDDTIADRIILKASFGKRS